MGAALVTQPPLTRRLEEARTARWMGGVDWPLTCLCLCLSSVGVHGRGSSATPHHPSPPHPANINLLATVCLQGRAIFASGLPQPDVEVDGKKCAASQANNM